MANPSLKNGYLSIATELIEKLARTNIPGNEMRILWVVWRKTWGWKEGDRHKDWDWIALSQFCKMTEMKHANVFSCLKSLVVKRLLVKSEKGYKFNQNYDEWVVVKRLPPVVKSIQGGSQKHTEIGSQKHTNNRNKETIQKKDYRAELGNIKTMKKNSFNYNESKHSDSYEETIDLETGDKVREAFKVNKNIAYKKMIEWAEKRRGFVFMNIPKQKKAFSQAVKYGIQPSSLYDRWEEYEKDKFWIGKGFDWMDVVVSFNKRK